MKDYRTREEILLDLGRQIEEEIIRKAKVFGIEAELNPFRVSIGVPFGPHKRNANAEVWGPEHVEDSVASIFIHPTVCSMNIYYVLSSLTHELIHVVVGPEKGHRGDFRKLSKLLGMTEPASTSQIDWTSPFGEWVSFSLLEDPEVQTYWNELNSYIQVPSRPKKEKYLIKGYCRNCGFVGYASKKHIDKLSHNCPYPPEKMPPGMEGGEERKPEGVDDRDITPVEPPPSGGGGSSDESEDSDSEEDDSKADDGESEEGDEDKGEEDVGDGADSPSEANSGEEEEEGESTFTPGDLGEGEGSQEGKEDRLAVLTRISRGRFTFKHQSDRCPFGGGCPQCEED